MRAMTGRRRRSVRRATGRAPSRIAVRIMLTSRQPYWLGWGPELTYLYNDPYKSIIGGRHPHALAKPSARYGPRSGIRSVRWPTR